VLFYALAWNRCLRQQLQCLVVPWERIMPALLVRIGEASQAQKLKITLAIFAIY
jgi:hypothetical protein